MANHAPQARLIETGAPAATATGAAPAGGRVEVGEPPARGRGAAGGLHGRPARAGPLAASLAERLRVRQFAKFCVVGTSGLAVDMAGLHLLVRWLGWNVSLAKLCSAETALLSNFLLNEFWTFRAVGGGGAGVWALALRLSKFQAICGAGIGWAVLLLNVFYRGLGINLYVANLLAILLVTLWNFWMNALFNWSEGARGARPRPVAAGRGRAPLATVTLPAVGPRARRL